MHYLKVGFYGGTCLTPCQPAIPNYGTRLCERIKQAAASSFCSKEKSEFPLLSLGAYAQTDRQADRLPHTHTHTVVSVLAGAQHLCIAGPRGGGDTKKKIEN